MSGNLSERQHAVNTPRSPEGEALSRLVVLGVPPRGGPQGRGRRARAPGGADDGPLAHARRRRVDAGERRPDREGVESRPPEHPARRRRARAGGPHPLRGESGPPACEARAAHTHGSGGAGPDPGRAAGVGERARRANRRGGSLPGQRDPRTDPGGACAAARAGQPPRFRPTNRTWAGSIRRQKSSSWQPATNSPAGRCASRSANARSLARNGSAVPQLIDTAVRASRAAPAKTSLRAKSAAPSNASGTAAGCCACVGQIAALETATARKRPGAARPRAARRIRPSTSR